MVERFNHTIEAMLSMFLSENQSDWDEHLPLLMMAFRSAFHETTGYIPYEMMLGRQIEVPIDIFLGRPKPEEASGKLASERQKRRYDHGAHKRLFHRGDAVCLHNP